MSLVSFLCCRSALVVSCSANHILPATFWKELLFYLSQALYQHWNG